MPVLCLREDNSLDLLCRSRTSTRRLDRVINPVFQSFYQDEQRVIGPRYDLYLAVSCEGGKFPSVPRKVFVGISPCMAVKIHSLSIPARHTRISLTNASLALTESPSYLNVPLFQRGISCMEDLNSSTAI